MEMKKGTYRNTTKQFKSVANDDNKFNISEKSGVLKINFFSDDNFRKLQNYRHTNNTKFYSFNPKADRAVKYVLRGLLIEF